MRTGTETRERVFDVFSASPFTLFDRAAIAKETGLSAGTCGRALADLTEAKAIQRDPTGGRHHYRLNEETYSRARRSANTPESPPTPNDGTPIWDLVIADMEERKRIGTEKYGTPLQAHNGRDALVDAYQEVLDAAVYLRQAIAERGCPACESEGGEPCIDHVRL